MVEAKTTPLTWKENFIKGILNSSKSGNWDEAIREWHLENIFWTKEFGKCLCRHLIKQHCIMRNVLNENTITVGNCCINKFPSHKNKDFTLVLQALKKGSVNAALITLSHDFARINDWEYNFMMNVWRKRYFSEKQMRKYNTIKTKLIAKIGEVSP